MATEKQISMLDWKIKSWFWHDFPQKVKTGRNGKPISTVAFPDDEFYNKLDVKQASELISLLVDGKTDEAKAMMREFGVQFK